MSQQERSFMSKPLSRREFLKVAAATSLGVSALGALPVAQALAAADRSVSRAELLSSPPPAEPVEIQYWDMVWGPPEFIDTGKKLTDMFNAEHPDIKVVYQSIPWTNWYQTFVTAIGSGTAPDISTGAAYQAVYFFGQGAIEPVNDVVEDLKQAGKLDDVVVGAVDRLKFGEDYVALPWAIDVRCMWFRKDLLDAAGVQEPTNWEEFKAVAQACTKGDQYGYVTCGPEACGHQNLWLWMFDNAGGWFTPERKVDVFYERNVEALEFFSSLVKAGVIHPGSVGYSNSETRRTLHQGRAAIMILNPGEPEQAPADVADKMVMASPLVGPHGDKGTISWVNNRMIYKQSKHPDAAKEVMKWWFDNELLLWTEGHCGNMTVRNSFTTNDYFQSKPYLKKAIAEWLPIGKSAGERVPGIFPELNTVEGEGFMDRLLQDLLQGKDVKEALQKVEAVLNVIVK